MQNKIKAIFYTIYLYIIFNINNIFAETPKILESVENNLPGSSTTISNVTKNIGGGLITTMIKYVAVIAVISLMLSGIMYLLSEGEEEKVKKAKSWIIWSLAGVLLSVSAMGIIEIINKIHLNNTI